MAVAVSRSRSPASRPALQRWEPLRVQRGRARGLWSYAVPGNPQDGSTAVSGGTVYVTTTSPGAGELFASSTNTHAQEWSFKAAATINVPAIAGNVVYAVAQNGFRYALNSTTGILLWPKQLHDGTAEPRPARSCGATGPETPCKPPRSWPTASSTSVPVPAARRYSRPSKQRLESVRGLSFVPANDIVLTWTFAVDGAG
jgi:hypothetical protein